MADSEMDGNPLKRRRFGGQRQRIQRAEERVAPPSLKSVFAQFLLQMFAWGTFSPQSVQHMAALVVQDVKDRLQDKVS